MSLPLIIAALYLASADKPVRMTHRHIRYHRRHVTPSWPGPGAPPPAPPRPVGPQPPSGFRRVITRPPAHGPRIPKIPARMIKPATSWLANLFGGGAQSHARAPARPAPARPSPADEVRQAPPVQRERPPPSQLPAQARTSTATTRAATPAARTPQAAASDLLAYFNAGRPLGTKDAPSSFVQAAQRDMGGIAADGIYGPETRSRGQALIGRPFPPRTAQPHPSQGRGVVGALYIP